MKEQEAYVKKGFWKKLKGAAAKVPFVMDAVAMYFCALDEKTPLWAKGIAFAALAYFVLPADAVPDFVPLVGFTDDAGAIAAAVTALGKNVTEDHKRQAREWANR